MLRTDTVRRTVEIVGNDINGALGYEYLVFAMGRGLAAEKIPGFFEFGHHLLGTRAALKFGAAVNDFNRRKDRRRALSRSSPACSRLRNGLCFAKRFELQMRDGDVHISVIFPESLDAAFGGARLHKELEAVFARIGSMSYTTFRSLRSPDARSKTSLARVE